MVSSGVSWSAPHWNGLRPTPAGDDDDDDDDGNDVCECVSEKPF